MSDYSETKGVASSRQRNYNKLNIEQTTNWTKLAHDNPH